MPSGWARPQRVIDAWAVSAATLTAGLDAAALDGSGGWAEPAPADAMRRVEQALRRCGDTRRRAPSGSHRQRRTLRLGRARGRRALEGRWRVHRRPARRAPVLAARSRPGGRSRVERRGATRCSVRHRSTGGSRRNPHVLSDPVFVHVVRATADSADEFVAGARGMHGYGAFGQLVGAPESASVLLGLTALLGTKVLVDGSVSVTRVTPGVAAPPTKRAAPPATRPPIREHCSCTDRPRRPRRSRAAGRRPADQNRALRRARRPPVGGLHQRHGRVVARRGRRAVRHVVERVRHRRRLVDRRAAHGRRRVGSGRAGGAAGDGGGRRLPRRPRDARRALGRRHHRGEARGRPRAQRRGCSSTSAARSRRRRRARACRVLSIEHDEDIVPAVGGSGHPSAERLTVSRSVLEEGATYDSALPAHELAALSRDGSAGRRVRRAAPRRRSASSSDSPAAAAEW